MNPTTRRALGGWVIAGLWLGLTAGPVLAGPAALLGPDGVLWWGPLTPSTPAVVSAGRGEVLVDPWTGGLWVEVVDLSLPGPGPEAAVRRVWEGGAWRWSTDERLVERRDGVTLTWLDGATTWSAASLRAEDLPSWPVNTRFEVDGRVALRTEEGWRVDDPRGRSLYGDAGELLWREDDRGNRVTWIREHGLLAGIARDATLRIGIRVDGDGRPSVLVGPDGAEHYLAHEDGLLVRAGPSSREARYTYDDDARLAGIRWSDGAQVQVAWTADGRVASTAGPGPRRTAYSWSGDGAEARTGAGAPTRFTRTSEGYTVRDPGGAEVRVQLADGRVSGWQDPSGVETRLTRQGGRVAALDGGGAWRLGWRDTALSELVDPLGARWQLAQQGGDLARVTDPDGRVVDLDWTTAGVLRSLDTGTGAVRWTRDGQHRLTEVQAANGSVTRVRWSGDGVAVQDPSGLAVEVAALDGPRTVLTSRLGERWTLWRDAFGRPERLGLPDGQVVELRRNSLGRLGALVVRDGPEVRYGWRSDGRPARVTDTLGASTTLSYDPAGRLGAITRTDGTVLRATRDPRGEVVDLAIDEDRWAVGRDRAGRPTSLGPLSWVWDAAGRWLGWAARGVEAVLERTGAGRVRTVQLSDGTRYGLDSDPAGRTTRVRTAAGTWRLERDPDGGVHTLDGPGVLPVKISRDDRGLPTLVTWGQARRRILRDAAGQPVKWTSSTGVALSVDRSGSGRPGLGRLPSGALSQWRHGPGESVLELLDPRGVPWLSRAVRRDDRGRRAVVQEGPSRTTWRWDPLGELVAVETADGAWSWLPGRLEGPGGHVVLFDEQDRPVTAVPPVGPAAWGLDGDRLEYVTDEAGRVVAITSDSGQGIELEHDALGRLTALVREQGQRWHLGWDPFGRPVVIDGPQGRRLLGQGPEGLLGWRDGDDSTELLSAAGVGWVEVTGESVREVLSDESGSPRIVSGDADPLTVAWGATGMPELDPGTPVGWQGRWSVLAGGPLLDGAGTLDPVSGVATVPGWRPPWWPAASGPVAWPQVDGAAAPWWDPTPWAPTTDWADPLALLVALGEVDAALPASELVAWTAGPPLGWLPAAAGTPPPPLLAEGEAVDPLLGLALRAGVAPVEPITTRAVLAAVLGPEFDGLPALDGFVEDPESWWFGGLDTWLAPR